MERVHQNLWKLGAFPYQNSNGWKNTNPKDKDAKLILSARSFILLDIQAPLTNSTRKKSCKKLWRAGDTTRANNSWKSFERHRTTIMYKVLSLKETILGRIWRRVAPSRTSCINSCQNNFNFTSVYILVSIWAGFTCVTSYFFCHVSSHTLSSRKQMAKIVI